MIINHYMLLKCDYILCSTRTRIKDFPWKARNSLDCLRVPSVFETVVVKTMVSKKMRNKLLMNSTRRQMNEICNVTRDVSPLKMVLIDMFTRTFVTYNRMFFSSVSVSEQLPLTTTYYRIPLKCNQ